MSSNEAEKCDKCGRDGVPLTTVTDHPDKHAGRYCNFCNPYGRADDDEAERIGRLNQKCRELRQVAQEFWDLQESITGSGAVRWVTFEDGAALIFTRMEYKDVLMRNIAERGLPLTFADYEESDHVG